MRQSLLEGLRLLSECTIRSHHIRGKESTLIQTFAQVELILPALMLAEHLLNKLDLVGWVICIRDAYIKDQISAPRVEAAAHYVSPECFLLCERCWIRRTELHII